MSRKKKLLPLPPEIAARGDLTPRAKVKAWCALQPPDGITQADLAWRLDVSVDTLIRLCKGGTVNPSTLLAVGSAAGFFDFGFKDPGMVAMSLSYMALSDFRAALTDAAEEPQKG